MPRGERGATCSIVSGPNLLSVGAKRISCLLAAQQFVMESSPCSPLLLLGSDVWGTEALTCSSSLPFAVSLCRYCGERSQFVVTSTSDRIEVRFHSDQSYTDTGFSAEYLSYDSSDRELKPWGWWRGINSEAVPPLC